MKVTTDEDWWHKDPEYEKNLAADTFRPSHRMERAQKAAVAKGCRIVLPRPEELFIDMDTQAAYDHFIAVGLRHLRRIFPDAEVKVTPSPSGKPGRYHGVVTLPRHVRDERERVLLQALLGSDLVRELVAWERIERRAPHPVLFFEKVENNQEPIEVKSGPTIPCWNPTTEFPGSIADVPIPTLNYPPPDITS